MLSGTVTRREVPTWPKAPFGYPPYEGGKHWRFVYDPIRKDFLNAFGDYSGAAGGVGTDNSHPEVYSYETTADKWTVLIDRATADVGAGWPRGVCIPGACFDSKRGVMWKTGGQERLASYPPNQVSGGLFAFRRSDKQWFKAGPNPDKESAHVSNFQTQNMVWCEATDALYVVASGAILKYDLADVVLGDGVLRDNWSRIASPVSDSLLGEQNQYALDTKRHRIVLYGPTVKQTWSFHTLTNSFSPLNVQPLPIHRLAEFRYHTDLDRVLLFGGLTETSYNIGNVVNKKVWAFSPDDKTWDVVPMTGADFIAPNAIYVGMASGYDAHNKCIVIASCSQKEIPGSPNFDVVPGSTALFVLRFADGTPPVVTPPEPPMTTIVVPVAGTYALQGSAPPVNQPPSVGVSVSATNVTVPATVKLTALASDPDGTLTKVEFLVNGAVLATDTTVPFSFDVNVTVAGVYAVTAKAYDNAGGVTESTPVVVTATDIVIPPQPPGTQPSAPGTMLMPVVQTAAQYPGIGPHAITTVWNGAAFDYTAKRFIIPVPGGHADWYPNASYQIQIPSGPSTRIHDMTPWGPPPKDANGKFISVSEYPDGKPCSRHIYQGACWLPNQKMVKLDGGSTFGASGSGDQYSGWLDPVTGKWTRKANVPFSPYVLGEWLLPDPLDADTVYCIMGGAIQVYKPSTDTYTAYPSVRGDIQGFGWGCSYAISPDGNWLYATRWGGFHPGHPESWMPGYGVQYVNMVLRKRLRQTTPQAWQPMLTTGDNAGLFLNASPGFEPDPERNAIVCWTPGDPSNVTLLNLSTHACTKVGIGSSPFAAHTMNGVYGRLRRYEKNKYALMVSPIHPVTLFTLP